MPAMEERGGWQTSITPDLAAFIAAQTSVFLATAIATASPISSIAAGLPAFSGARRQDHRLCRFFRQQAIHHPAAISPTIPRRYLFLIDYAHRQRIKIWGDGARCRGRRRADGQADAAGYKARPEQVILFTVSAWDSNCPQHIPQRFEAADVAAALNSRDRRIAELEAEIARLKTAATVNCPLPPARSFRPARARFGDQARPVADQLQHIVAGPQRARRAPRQHIAGLRRQYLQRAVFLAGRKDDRGEPRAFFDAVARPHVVAARRRPSASSPSRHWQAAPPRR